MFWLRRPPYLRWLAATTVLLLGIMLDLRPDPVVAYPFASDVIRAGETIESVTWRDVPAGVLPEWQGPLKGTAATDIPPASPILPSMTVDGYPVPSGWWVISLPMPGVVPPGASVRIAIDGLSAEGVVAGETADNGFELTAPVAFPPETVEIVTAMVTNSALVVMTGT